MDFLTINIVYYNFVTLRHLPFHYSREHQFILSTASIINISESYLFYIRALRLLMERTRNDFRIICSRWRMQFFFTSLSEEIRWDPWTRRSSSPSLAQLASVLALSPLLRLASDCTEKNPRFTARPNTLATREGDRKSSGATRNLLDELKKNGNTAVAVALPDARVTYASSRRRNDRLRNIESEDLISSKYGISFHMKRVDIIAKKWRGEAIPKYLFFQFRYRIWNLWCFKTLEPRITVSSTTI